MGAVSDDRFGATIAAQLADDRVSTELLQRVSVPTTLAAAELDAGGAATYRFYTAMTSAPALHPTALPAATETLFAGGLGLVLEPMADTVAGIVDGVGDGVMVMIDLNCRPAVIDDRDRYVARVDAVLGRADVVKVSDDDLAYLAPGVPPIAAARRLLAQRTESGAAHGGWSTRHRADGGRRACRPRRARGGGRLDRRRRRLRRRVHVVVGRRPAGGGPISSTSTRSSPPWRRPTGSPRSCARVAGADPPWRHEMPADWVT